ncbi:MAG TPA: UDP-N-acetylmuramoyl-L-alanine--D-glutamate ligase [Spirochaetota bacterium]|nr:UDP-N-acetylmuramoyl-L-alanine--D-glutamate ligase [Spirochaetota bacterium]
MNDEYKNILVVGLGYRTGLATSNFLAGKGKSVTVTDIKTEPELKDIIDKLDPAVKVIAGDQSPEILDAGFELVVLSPGVPAVIPLLVEAKKRGIPVIAEIELAYRYMKGRIIAITGTDGKSTTTTLTGYIFRALGFCTFVGGNIGVPLVTFADDTTDDSVTVIELSSFQLETIDTFRPDVAAILNVTPDHLDRYNSIDDYFAAKKRIFMNQTDDDWFVYNKDNEILALSGNEYPRNVLKFSAKDSDADADSFFLNNSVYYRSEVIDLIIAQENELKIIGIHNMQNIMASILMVVALHKKLGAVPDFDRIVEACRSFPGLEHRMENVGEYMGRTFVNDSKATTIGAVEMAVKSIKDKGVIIVGGRTKGDDYSRLVPVLKDKARMIVLIGESSDEFAELFKDSPHVRAGSMEDAVVKAMQASEDGDMILLSPACASFDMFTSYDERGKVFKECFRKLMEGELSWN